MFQGRCACAKHSWCIMCQAADLSSQLPNGHQQSTVAEIRCRQRCLKLLGQGGSGHNSDKAGPVPTTTAAQHNHCQVELAGAADHRHVWKGSKTHMQCPDQHLHSLACGHHQVCLTTQFAKAHRHPTFLLSAEHAAVQQGTHSQGAVDGCCKCLC